MSQLAPLQHLVADLHGVAPAPLRDSALLSGLLIAAAGAGGFSATGAPLLRHLPGDGVAGVLPLDDCHMTLYTFPARGLLLLDVLSDGAHDPRKALDVFVRRLAPGEVRSDSRPRGG